MKANAHTHHTHHTLTLLRCKVCFQAPLCVCVMKLNLQGSALQRLSSVCFSVNEMNE